MRSYADFELAVHAVCWMWLPLTLPIPRSVLSSRGTVSLYVQLSVPMHSDAGFGLALRAVCWTWPPLPPRMLRSVHSLRHRQLVRAAVGSNAQLRRLWACSACNVHDVAAAYFHMPRSVLSVRQRQLLRAAVGSPMHSYAGFGLAVHAVCWTWPPLTFHMLRSVLSWRHRQLVCAAFSSPMHSFAGFGLAVHAVCMMWPPLTFICLAACSV